MKSIIPRAPSPPNLRLSEKCILIYSVPGIGKTHLAATFRKALFLPTEPGTEEMEVAAVPEIQSWQDFVQYVEAVGREDHEYETVVLDTVGALYGMCHEHICKLNGWKDVDDGAHGRGWRKVKDEWSRQMNKLRALRRVDGRKLCVIFLDHERREEIVIKHGSSERKTGRHAVTSSLPGAGRKMLHGMVQHIWRLTVNDAGERILQTQPVKGDGREDVEAKTRGPKGLVLPAEINIGPEGVGFRRIATAWSETFKNEDAPGWTPPRKAAEAAGEEN